MDHAPSAPPPTDQPHVDPLWEMFHDARRAPDASGAAGRAWTEDYEEVE